MSEQSNEIVREREPDDPDTDDPDFDDPESVDDGDPASRTANVGETSVEINVEELIAEFEAERAAAAGDNPVARKRLEEILEEKRIARELEDMEDFDFDLGY